MTVSDIVMTLFFAWVVVVSGLVGALVPSSYKWGYYAFGLAALFYLWCVPPLVVILLVNNLFRTCPQVPTFRPLLTIPLPWCRCTLGLFRPFKLHRLYLDSLPYLLGSLRRL